MWQADQHQNQIAQLLEHIAWAPRYWRVTSSHQVLVFASALLHERRCKKCMVLNENWSIIISPLPFHFEQSIHEYKFNF